MSVEPTTAAMIVPPPAFPVVWDDPADAAHSWRLERVHWPGIQTRFDFAVTGQLVWGGMEAAARYYGMPPSGQTCRRINGYHYYAATATQLPEAERARMAADSDRRMAGISPCRATPTSSSP